MDIYENFLDKRHKRPKQPFQISLAFLRKRKILRPIITLEYYKEINICKWFATDTKTTVAGETRWTSVRFGQVHQKAPSIPTLVLHMARAGHTPMKGPVSNILTDHSS